MGGSRSGGVVERRNYVVGPDLSGVEGPDDGVSGEN